MKISMLHEPPTLGYDFDYNLIRLMLRIRTYAHTHTSIRVCVLGIRVYAHMRGLDDKIRPKSKNEVPGVLVFLPKNNPRKIFFLKSPIFWILSEVPEIGGKYGGGSNQTFF